MRFRLLNFLDGSGFVGIEAMADASAAQGNEIRMKDLDGRKRDGPLFKPMSKKEQQSKTDNNVARSILRAVTTNLADSEIRRFFNENPSAEELIGTYTTALPFVPIGCDMKLQFAGDTEELANGFRIVRRNALPVLDKFKATLDYQELYEPLRAEYYLVTEHAITIKRDSPSFDHHVADGNRERVEKFILALNITGRLCWLCDPQILNWFDPTEFRTAEGIRSAYLASFEGDIYSDDLRSAAALIATIELVCAENERRNEFSAVRVALDALDGAVRDGTIALRFIQNMIAIEALCSTSNFEVQHRVGTTAAVLLRSTLVDRRRFYDRVTRLYDARSRMIHGSGRKITKEELKEVEQIARALVAFVLNDEVLPNYRNSKSQKEFLLNAVLETGSR